MLGVGWVEYECYLLTYFLLPRSTVSYVPLALSVFELGFTFGVSALVELPLLLEEPSLPRRIVGLWPWRGGGRRGGILVGRGDSFLPCTPSCSLDASSVAWAFLSTQHSFARWSVDRYTLNLIGRLQ